jgi:hypothetical protein
MLRFSSCLILALIFTTHIYAAEPRSVEELLNAMPIGTQMPVRPMPGFTRQGTPPSPMISDNGMIDGQETNIVYLNGKIYGIHFGSIDNIPNGDNKLARLKYDEFYKFLLSSQKRYGGELMYNPKTKYGNYEYYQADLNCATFKISVYSGSGNDRINPYTKLKMPGTYSVDIVSKVGK